MPAKLPAQQRAPCRCGSEKRRAQLESKSSTKSCKYDKQTGREEKIKYKTKKSNKCLLTTTPNGTESPPNRPSHCSFSTLFAYELWIENWNCDFSSAAHLSLQLFFRSRRPTLYNFFCMLTVGRYRNAIVLSTLKDSSWFNLHRWLKRGTRQAPAEAFAAHSTSIAQLNFIYICEHRILKKFMTFQRHSRTFSSSKFITKPWNVLLKVSN